MPRQGIPVLISAFFQQLAAIHTALQGAGRIFLQEYAIACLVEMDAEVQLD